MDFEFWRPLSIIFSFFGGEARRKSIDNVEPAFIVIEDDAWGKNDGINHGVETYKNIL